MQEDNQAAISLVELAQQATTAYGRADLTARLDRTADRLRRPDIRVLVVGEFKQGKSSLINAMINAPVCPVDDDIATSVPTIIHYADEPDAAVVVAPESGDTTEHRQPISVDQLPVYATERGNPANARHLRSVEVGVPRQILAGGLTLVDTPGVGGLGSAHTATTTAALPMADAVLFVTDASQELTVSELEFIETAGRACARIGFVMTKTDLYPEWSRISEINTRHLRAVGVTGPMFHVSAPLRLRAIETDDRMLNLESGYPHLTEFLRGVVGEIQAGSGSGAAAEVTAVAAELEQAFAAERDALADPDRAQMVIDRFTEAKTAADALRHQAARWQVTLNDGVADLTADFDHTLKERLRLVVREAEEALDAQDPGEIWAEFEAWLQRRVSHDLAQTYIELSARTDELSIQVAEHFDASEQAMKVGLDAAPALRTTEALATRKRVEADDQGVGSRALTAMRGSYGGFLMFGMLGQMAGLAMMNPATALIGVLMGGKAVKDEKERQLMMRRQQAKITTRQYIDDASFAVGKELRDALKGVQRNLRDHYQVRAEEMNKSITESLAAAKSAMDSDTTQRAGRLRDVEAELGRIATLRDQAAALADRDRVGMVVA